MEENLKNDEKKDKITQVDPDKRNESFNKMLNILLDNAKKEKRPIEELISEYIYDLRNNGKEGYEKKIKNISLDLSKETIKNCIDYMNRRLKFYKQQSNQKNKKLKSEEIKMQKKQTEENWKRLEEIIDELALAGENGSKIEIIQKIISNINEGKDQYNSDREKTYMLKKLTSMLEKENKKEADRKKEEEKIKIAQETDKIKAQKAMSYIQEIVDREYKEGNIKNKANYLKSIKDAINGENDDIELSIKPEEGVKDQLLQIIDEKIEVEKEEYYYEQVINFTNDLDFISEEEMRVKGKRGRMTKFADLETAKRFQALVTKIKRGEDEYLQIGKLLKSKKLNETDKRILNKRKEVLDEVREYKENGNVR